MGVGGFDEILLRFIARGCGAAEMIIGMSYKHELNNTLLRFAWS